MTELLPPPIIDARNAEPTTAGVRLLRPWGWLRVKPVTLKTGWYMLAATGSSGVCVQLFSPVTAKLIELSATPDATAFVRLEGGTFEITLFCGVRPGDYELSGVKLVPLSFYKRARLLAGRLIHALTSGISLSQLRRLIRLAFTPGTTYGLRAANQTRLPSDLGMLTAADRFRVAPPADTPAPLTFLVKTIDGEISDTQRTQFGLDDQTHTAFTLNPLAPHDAVLWLAPQETLTPDALALFADALSHRPEIKLALADIWQAGTPTTHVAFDPLLYAEGFPTPYVCRTGFDPIGQDWCELESASIVISVPLARRAEAPPIRPEVSLPSPTERPVVSVIIPTRDRADLLQAALDGLFEATDWPHEVIIVDNGSIEPATFALFDAFKAKGLQVVTANMPFNFSTLCNLGAAAATGDYLVFMNNDVVLKSPDWLRRMMEQAMRPQSGAVGARLLYGDGRLQHAGVALGLTEVCGHLWRGLPYDAQQKMPSIVRNGLRSAVTAALLCVERRKFDAVGGFDDIQFPVTLNDIDLCLKLRTNGWYNIYAARAEAYHLEGESRGQDEAPAKRARRLAELDAFRRKWAAQIAEDPWLPPALMRSTETFGLK